MSDMTARSLKFTYTNWKGETSERWATPLSFRWGTTEWHPKAGWLMRAFDHDKGAEREFALRDCAFARVAAHAAGRKEALEEAAELSEHYASHYPQGSDGRNTFTILADTLRKRKDIPND